MPFKEINDLRKSGNHEQALSIAEKELAVEPENIWNKRAAAWVYYEYLKKYATPESFDQFIDYLEKLKSLNLPESETMVFDAIAWQIGKMMTFLKKPPAGGPHILNFDIDLMRKSSKIFSLIREFSFPKPSKSYSFLLKSFHKAENTISLLEWWGIENLRPEDYLEQEYNGRKIMALVQQVFISYSKELLNGVPYAYGDLQEKIDAGEVAGLYQSAVDFYKKDKYEKFLQELDSTINNHPEYLYLPYYKAKLLLAMGKEGDILSSFLPFAKQTRHDFWIWDLLADLHSNNQDLMLVCYLKALSLKTPDQFLVNLRHKLIPLLITKGMYKEAKTEIEKILAVRIKNKWKIPDEVSQWKNLPWYKSETAGPNNNELYSKYSQQAEELLLQGDPEQVIAIEFVNKNKKILNFVQDQSKHGVFNYSGLIQNPKIGEILLVRFDGEGQNGYYRALTLKRADSKVECPAIKKYAGPLHLIPLQNFGFVDNVFVNAQQVREGGLVEGQKVQGRAIISFNKKKNEWGWKAIDVE